MVSWRVPSLQLFKIFAPENGWLEDGAMLVSGSVGFILKYCRTFSPLDTFRVLILRPIFG